MWRVAPIVGAYLDGVCTSGLWEARLADGAKVRGYCCWSLLDNLEWDMGWGQRFGLVYVDYQTLNRTVKDSGWWYRDAIAASRYGEGGQ